MKRINGRVVITAAALASLVVANSCGKKKSSNDGSDENPLASAYPSDLGLSAFPTSGTKLADDDNSVTKRPAKEKIEDQENRIHGRANECIDPRIFKTSHKDDPQQTSEPCYQFDWDMNPYTYNGASGGTKTGLNASGEACMVAFAREQVNKAADKVDRGLALIGGIMCQAKKSGASTALPGVGETIDLSSVMGTALPPGLTPKTATIKRLADSSSGAAVYQSVVEVADGRGKTMTTTLTHSPGVDGAESGVLSQVVAEQDSGAGDSNNSGNKNNAMSINYSKELVDGKSRMRFEVRRASIVNSITPLTSEGLVNYPGIAANATNSTVHKIAFLAFDMDPETSAGSLSYWMNPGGGNTESARGFLFNVTASSDGSLVGCGVSGAANNVSIRKAVTDGTVFENLKPTNWYHPFENSNTNADRDSGYNDQIGSKITKQCFKRNDATGVYDIDAAQTTGSRGYDLIEGTANPIAPPPRPAKKVEINP
jgi:hypothetical protein